MAAPSILAQGNGSNKTTSTSTVAGSAVTVAVGDVLLAALSLDPASGTVSAATTSGATGAATWSILEDAPNGSGTSGVRLVVAQGLVTSAGGVGVTFTHPSVAAKAFEIYKVTGADGTTPVMVHGKSIVSGSNGAAVTLTAGADVALICIEGSEGAAGNAVGVSPPTGTTQPNGWTFVSNDSLDIGTTGGSATSNITICSEVYTTTGTAAGSVTPVIHDGHTTDAWVTVVFQAPTSTGTLFTQSLTAGVGFTGAENASTSTTKAAGVSFTGTGPSRAVTRTVTAALGFAGSTVRRVSLHAFTAAVGFTGSLVKGAVHFVALAAGIGFAGSIPRRSIGVPQSGTVGFAGSTSRAVRKGLPAAGLGFAGSITRQVGRRLSAGLGAAGSLTTAAVHHFTQTFTAALGLTGSQTRATATSRTAGVGFAGTQSKRINAVRAGAVGFQGTLTRRISRVVSAGLGFVGNFATVLNGGAQRFTQTFTATVGFTGSQVRSVRAVLAGSVAASGSLTRSVTRRLAAGLGLAGSTSRSTRRTTAATVGFTGHQTAGSLFSRTFTATVGFTGSQAKVVRVHLVAGLTLAGSAGKRIGKALAAVLGLVGSWAGVQPAQVPLQVAESVGTDRWAGSVGADRWATAAGTGRWAGTMGTDRWQANVGAGRWTSTVEESV